MTDHPDSVTCPTCGEKVRIGLPRSAAVEAVTDRPDAELDDEFLPADSRKKRRRTDCSNDHAVHVYFQF